MIRQLWVNFQRCEFIFEPGIWLDGDIKKNGHFRSKYSGSTENMIKYGSKLFGTVTGSTVEVIKSYKLTYQGKNTMCISFYRTHEDQNLHLFLPFPSPRRPRTMYRDVQTLLEKLSYADY